MARSSLRVVYCTMCTITMTSTESVVSVLQACHLSVNCFVITALMNLRFFDFTATEHGLTGRLHSKPA